MTTETDFYDKQTAPNTDYIVARGGFVFDLSCWADEAPVDEPDQPLGSDLAALRYLLSAANTALNASRMIHVAGFTPWAFKYVDSRHGGVPTEWESSELFSAFNAFVDGDACCIGVMANAAFFQHFPLPARLVQAPPPTQAGLVDAGLLLPNGTVPSRLYYIFYAGE